MPPRCRLKTGGGKGRGRGGIGPRGCQYKTDSEGRDLKSVPARAVIDNKNPVFNRQVVASADKYGRLPVPGGDKYPAIKNDIVDRTLFGQLLRHVDMAVLPQKSTGVGREQGGGVVRRISVTFMVNGNAIMSPLPVNPGDAWYTLDTGAEASCYMPMRDFTDLTGWGPNVAVQWLNNHASPNNSIGVGGANITTWNIAMTVEVLAKSSPSGKRKAALPPPAGTGDEVIVPRGGACIVTIADRSAGINRLIGQTFLRAFQLPVR